MLQQCFLAWDLNGTSCMVGVGTVARPCYHTIAGHAYIWRYYMNIEEYACILGLWRVCHGVRHDLEPT